TSRSAFAIARSPPFTATYMSILRPHRARQHRNSLGRGEHEVDAAGIEGAVLAPLQPEFRSHAVHDERGRCRDTGAAEASRLAVQKAGHLDDHGRRVLRPLRIA